jgi:hypothetical protein
MKQLSLHINCFLQLISDQRLKPSSSSLYRLFGNQSLHIPFFLTSVILPNPLPYMLHVVTLPVFPLPSVSQLIVKRRTSRYIRTSNTLRMTEPEIGRPLSHTRVASEGVRELWKFMRRIPEELRWGCGDAGLDLDWMCDVLKQWANQLSLLRRVFEDIPQESRLF